MGQCHLALSPPVISSQQWSAVMLCVSIPSLLGVVYLTGLFCPFYFAQFIGSLEISRPTSKLDIITAMRRIRVSGCGSTPVGVYPIRIYVYV